MKILKDTGSYLKEKANLNKNISYIFFAIGGAGLIYSFVSIHFYLIYILVFTIGIGTFFFKRYLNYNGGLEGENLVIQYLQYLNDDYFLINDIKLQDSYSNIDHIVLGPNGIFVIETKNYGGQIICSSDKWIRRYEGCLKISMKRGYYWQEDMDYNLGSPSKQAKRNAAEIKQIVESTKVFKKPLNIWVEGIVVFTNPDMDLWLSNTTVPILRPNGLCEYIKNKKSRIRFSSQELELIGKVILKAGGDGLC